MTLSYKAAALNYSNTLAFFAPGMGINAQRFIESSKLGDVERARVVVPESPGLTWTASNIPETVDLITEIYESANYSRLLMGGHSAGATFVSRLAPWFDNHPTINLEGLWLYSGTWTGTFWRWAWPKAETATVRRVVCSWDQGRRQVADGRRRLRGEGRWAAREMQKAGIAYADSGARVRYDPGHMGRHKWDARLNDDVFEFLTKSQ